jgi:hypothetical protein
MAIPSQFSVPTGSMATVGSCGCSVPVSARALLIDAATGDEIAELNRIHRDGLFFGRDLAARLSALSGCASSKATMAFEEEDAYRFPPVLGELDNHLFAEGRSPSALREARRPPGDERRQFPAPSFCSVVCSQCQPGERGSAISTAGDGRRHPMRKRQESGPYGKSSCRASAAASSTNTSSSAAWRASAAQGRSVRLRAGAATLDGFAHSWAAEPFLATTRPGGGCSGAHDIAAPIAIYEVHLRFLAARRPQQLSRL